MHSESIVEEAMTFTKRLRAQSINPLDIIETLEVFQEDYMGFKKLSIRLLSIANKVVYAL
jgi:hypothetical protein